MIEQQSISKKTNSIILMIQKVGITFKNRYYQNIFQHYLFSFKTSIMIMDQQIEDKCMICLSNFNEQEKIPMVICFQQHLCCKQCLNYYLKQKQEKFKCPLCNKSDIPLKRIKRFRHYSNFQNKIKSIKDNYQGNSQSEINKLVSEANQQNQISKCVQSLFQGNINEANEKISILINLGIKLLKLKKIKEASKIFKKIIEKNPLYDEGEFIGLGCYQDSVGFYESRAVQWVQKRYKQMDVSVYDLLGLCFLIRPNFLMQKAWYKRMIQKYPNNFKLTYGLALTYHNDDQLDQAEKLYKEIILMNPKFDKPYEMLGFIQLQRDNLNQYFEYAQKCLQINSNNIYAKYLYARYKIIHEESQNARQQILRIHNQQTEFVRPLHYLAIHFNHLKLKNQSYYYLDKCIQINPHYYWATINKAGFFISDGKYKDGIQILQNLYRKDINKSERQKCNKLFGYAYFKTQNYMEAIHYYHLFFSDDEEYKNNLYHFYCLMISYIENDQEETAISKCNQLMLKFPNSIEVQIKCHQVFICINFFNQKYEQTVRSCLQYQQKYPQWNTLKYYLAKSYCEIGMLEQSEKHCKFCLQNNVQIASIAKIQKIIDQKRQSKNKEKVESVYIK